MEHLYTILNATGDRRVEIYRDNGTFRYREQYWSDEPRERCWCPTVGSDTSICDSEEIAWREALGNIPWLKEVVPQGELP